ncbi:MAG: fimbrillin family protein [Odoribacter sp.]
MKHPHSLYTLLCGALLAAASCSHDTDTAAIVPDGRTALQVTSGIHTRAHDKTWEADDAIGIYMLSGATVETDNNKYITAAGGENGTFTPAATPADQTIYFPIDGSTRDFVAYYPYATIGTNNLYAVNVVDQTSQKAIDLMAADKVTGKSKTEPNVPFVFTHKLTKLEITLKGDGTSTKEADLAGTVVKITHQQTAGTYNVLTGGEVSVTTAAAAEVTLPTEGMKAEGIVLPNDDTKEMKLTFTVPLLKNQTFEWLIKSATASQKFEAGKKYKYTITISKMGVSVTATVTDWIPGNGSGEPGEAN